MAYHARLHYFSGIIVLSIFHESDGCGYGYGYGYGYWVILCVVCCVGVYIRALPLFFVCAKHPRTVCRLWFRIHQSDARAYWSYTFHANRMVTH
jgi:hypothetical protein